jgi:hypothetical protein
MAPVVLGGHALNPNPKPEPHLELTYEMLRSFCPENVTCGSADTGDNACYAPDIDHHNPRVQVRARAPLSADSSMCVSASCVYASVVSAHSRVLNMCLHARRSTTQSPGCSG